MSAVYGRDNRLRVEKDEQEYQEKQEREEEERLAKARALRRESLLAKAKATKSVVRLQDDVPGHAQDAAGEIPETRKVALSPRLFHDGGYKQVEEALRDQFEGSTSPGSLLQNSQVDPWSRQDCPPTLKVNDSKIGMKSQNSLRDESHRLGYRMDQIPWYLSPELGRTGPGLEESRKSATQACSRPREGKSNLKRRRSSSHRNEKKKKLSIEELRKERLFREETERKRSQDIIRM